MSDIVNKKKSAAGTTLPLITPLALLAALIAVNVVLVSNDIWWLLAMGKSIIENGIPVIEPLTLHEGLDFIAQQWLSSTIFYCVYYVFGYAGILVLVTAVDALIIYLMHKLCTLFGGSTRMTGLIAAVMSAVFVVMNGISRPQIFSFCLLIIDLICLEKYARENDWKVLIPLPFLSILGINLHASIWPMLLVFALPYIAEGILKRIPWSGRKAYNGKSGIPAECSVKYKLMPLIASCIVMAGCGFINPYGIKAMTYLTTSYGYESINGLVAEMMAPSMQTHLIGFVVIEAVIILLCRAKKKYPLRYIFLAAGTVYLSLSSMKGMAFGIIACTPVIAYGMGDIRLAESIRKKPLIPTQFRKTMTIFFCAVVMAVMLIVQIFTGVTGNITDTEPYSVSEALEYVEANEDIQQGCRVYSDYNTGGYFEFKGYRPYIDTRAEIFMKDNNGKKDILDEYLIALYDPYECENLIREYGFEYIFVSPDNALNTYLEHTEGTGYEKIYTTSTNEVYEIVVWKKIFNESEQKKWII